MSVSAATIEGSLLALSECYLVVCLVSCKERPGQPDGSRLCYWRYPSTSFWPQGCGFGWYGFRSVLMCYRYVPEEGDSRVRVHSLCWPLLLTSSLDSTATTNILIHRLATGITYCRILYTHRISASPHCYCSNITRICPGSLSFASSTQRSVYVPLDESVDATIGKLSTTQLCWIPGQHIAHH